MKKVPRLEQECFPVCQDCLDNLSFYEAYGLTIEEYQDGLDNGTYQVPIPDRFLKEELP